MKALLLAPLALAACAATRPVVPVGPAVAVAAPAAPAVLPFIEDDYPRALAEARARKLPLFVDAWAPWCHTCRFMRAFVLGDPALAADAGRFVWLGIDTEKDANAAFVARYPISVLPTMMVIDAAREAAVVRWPGSATTRELQRVLADGERAVAQAAAQVTAKTAAPADLARVHSALADGRLDDALHAWESWRASLSPEERPHAVESLALALSAAHAWAPCADLAVREAPQMPRGSSFANVVATALYCAETGRLSEAQLVLTPLAEEALALPGLLADDRSGLFELLVARHAEALELDVARALALQWLAFLEEEAGKAPTVEARVAFDPHRAAAAVAAGDPARAIAPLLQSEKDLPADYNAPARLAMIYLELGRLDEALAASDRALARAYGPRRVRLLDNRATILDKRGDRAGARKALEAALAIADTMPDPPRAAVIARVRARLDALPATPAR